MGTKNCLQCLLFTVLVSFTYAGLVKKVQENSQQSQAAPEPYNITLPSAGQAVVFNHVYNIKVPAGSMCSVDLDAPGGTSALESKDGSTPSDLHATEHTLDGENQIVFTHRINIPRQACGCADGMPELKALLSRLEMLEGEVSTLRDQCTGESCCSAQVTGEVGTKPYCNGRGNYSSEACGCICEPGWKGPNCTEPDCPNDCQDQGRCVDGKCVCFEGFDGEDCKTQLCRVDCGENGHCIDGKCACFEGFDGEDCKTQLCRVDCGENGHCIDGKCVCFEGFDGEDCKTQLCRVDCGKNGHCIDGKCVCFEGFDGEDCKTQLCRVDCGENGRCIDGKCACFEGFAGEDCKTKLCRVDCGENGRCIDGKCVCFEGFAGEDCKTQLCRVDCGENGHCIDGKCACFEGFAGEDCKTQLCRVDCGKNGQCLGGICVCTEGFLGEDCSQTACLNNCLGRGRCVDGDCECDEPWTGYDCSELICPKDCYDRGRCENGTCFCDEGYTGEDCGEKTCLNNCRGNGFCVDGRCICSAGYSGDDCSKLTCLNDCSGRGTCFNGLCICDPGYQGEDCSQLACLNNCHSRGQCINGRCACDVGFQGEDCSELSCPNDCQKRGRCVNGQCVCNEGFTGEDCSIKTCPSDCFGRGECIDGQCVCFAGFTGEDCGALSCPNNCLNRGRCVDGQCVCDEGFTGEDCSQKACPNDCLARGQCVDGKCICQEGYTGDDCSVLTCPDNCNNRGRCVKGKCVCEEGYEGDNCGELSCLNNCQDKGRCVNGQCICDEGYIGLDCSEVSPPKDLTVTDVTPETVDLSWQNEMLVTEYLVTYVPTSPGGLYQEFTVPGDRTAATVKELEPGIEYLINVYAILSNKKSIPVSARVATHLPQPEGLKFKTVRETTVEVQWDQLDISFDGWELYFRNTKEENGKILTSLPSSQNEFELTGLGPGQEYEVSLGIVKNNTKGPQATKTVTTKIDGPKQLEVKDVTDSSALVTWSQPVAQVDGVSVSYKPSSEPSGWSQVELSPADKQLSIDRLSPDTEYQVSLISRKADATSEPVTATFTTDLDAPRDVQILSQTDDSITLKWSNSQANVDTYMVKYSPISGAAHSEELFPSGSADTTEATITGLKPGTEYGIGVTAVKNDRESLPATTNAATELDAPKNLEVSVTTETTLNLVWQRPKAKITGYRLVYVSRDGQSKEEAVPATANSYALTSLSPGVLYTITLTAERGQKKSAPATLSTTTGLGSPKGIHFSDVTDTSAIVHWTKPRAQVDTYRIIYVPLEGGMPMIEAADGTDTQALLTNMQPGVTYQVTLIAVKSLEESEPSTDTVTTALDMPQGLAAVNVTHTSALLLWQPAVATVDGYVITYSADSVPPVVEHVSGNTIEFEMGSLVPATQYQVGVYAVRDTMKSAPANTAFTTDVDPPHNLVASNIHTDSATLTWEPPRAAVTGYMLTFASPDGATREVVLSPTASSYSMSQLTGSTEYTVRLQAIAGDQRSRHVNTVFTTIGILYSHPKDCSQAFLNGDTTSGVYTIYIGGEESRPLQVYCDMTTDGGGWTVFMRRQNGKLEFFRNWKNYTGGFGNLSDEFWLGLSHLQKITSSGQYELRVDLADNGETAYAQYDKFTLSEPRSRYKIYVGAYSGTAGDSMTYHQGRPFSTYDHDNDIAVTNCALSYKGAFWYKNCHRANLMGKYGDNSHSKGINWFHWKGHEHSIQFAEMKLRPVNFINFQSRRKRS